ncbi:MAG: OmpH family outer membrane protein [Smithellaceae bacterium]|nr:OmpH family outer membrane protein [Smithellaceae bacterium]
MKKNIFIISGLILLLFVWSTASYAEEKIGFVNMQDILLNSNAGKRAEAEFKKIVDRKQASIKTMENEIQKMQNELEKQSAVMTAATRKAKQEAYMKKMREYQRLVDTSNQELQKSKQESIAKMVPDISKIVSGIAEREKFTVIMDNMSVHYFSDKSHDITKKVMAEYNKL